MNSKEHISSERSGEIEKGVLNMGNIESAMGALLGEAEYEAEIGGKKFIGADERVITEFITRIPCKEDGTFSEDTRKIGDKLFEMAISGYEEHYSVMHSLLGRLLQEQTVSPKLLIEKTLELFQKIDTDPFLREDLLHSVDFQLNTYESSRDSMKTCMKEILQRGNIYEISRSFEFVYLLLDMSLFENTRQAIEIIIGEISGDVPDKYFIQKRLEELNKIKLYSNTRDVTNSSNYRGKWKQSMEENLTEADTAVIKRLDKDELQQSMFDTDRYDYAYMMSSHVRERIEKDLGIEMSWLFPRERYYLLQFLKNSDVSKVSSARDFFHKFSLAGVHAFIITDYDNHLGDRIISFANKNEESAQEIFILFESIVGQIETFSNRFKEISEKDSTLLSKDDVHAFSDQVYEAWLRKAKDLLIATIESDNLQIPIEDIKASMKGMHMGLCLINSFFGQDNYKCETLVSQKDQEPQFLLTDLTGKQYRLKFNVRPRAEEGAQARINVEIHFDTDNPNTEMRDTFSQETQWRDNPKRKGIQKENALRFGVDLDTDSPKRQGLSLDIGRAAITSDKRTSTGDKLGNILNQMSSESTHTPYSFDKKFSDPEVFARLANAFKDYLKNK
jgi:hypothetical protein